jgi:hypothetical protein
VVVPPEDVLVELVVPPLELVELVELVELEELEELSVPLDPSPHAASVAVSRITQILRLAARDFERMAAAAIIARSSSSVPGTNRK